MITNMRLRRGLVVLGVLAALVGGLLAIRVAAILTEAAAPPPAPPISLDSLKSDLAAEQARGEALQAQLTDLTGLTVTLSDALDTTQSSVSANNKSAAQLAKQLKAAQDKLGELKALLAAARRRLLAVGDTKGAAATKPGGGSSTGGSSSNGGSTGGGSTTGSMTLSLSRSGGDVTVDWTSCSVSGFTGYAVVRSTDREIHWPPEDHDTEIVRVSSASTTRYVDRGAPSGSLTYKAYCLATQDHETKSVQATPAQQISVP